MSYFSTILCNIKTVLLSMPVSPTLSHLISFRQKIFWAFFISFLRETCASFSSSWLNHVTLLGLNYYRAFHFVISSVLAKRGSVIKVKKQFYKVQQLAMKWRIDWRHIAPQTVACFNNTSDSVSENLEGASPFYYGFLRFAFISCESVKLIKEAIKYYEGSFTAHGMAYRRCLALFKFILVSDTCLQRR